MIKQEVQVCNEYILHLMSPVMQSSVLHVITYLCGSVLMLVIDLHSGKWKCVCSILYTMILSSSCSATVHFHHNLAFTR